MISVGYEKKIDDRYLDTVATRMDSGSDEEIETDSANRQYIAISEPMGLRVVGVRRPVSLSYAMTLSKSSNGAFYDSIQTPKFIEISPVFQEPVTRKLFPDTWLFDSISDLG